MGYKIREAQLQKTPYMLVMGDKEVEAGTVAVRHRSAGDLGSDTPAGIAEKIARSTAERALHEETAKPGGAS